MHVHTYIHASIHRRFVSLCHPPEALNRISHLSVDLLGLTALPLEKVRVRMSSLKMTWKQIHPTGSSLLVEKCYWDWNLLKSKDRKWLMVSLINLLLAYRWRFARLKPISQPWNLLIFYWPFVLNKDKIKLNRLFLSLSKPYKRWYDFHLAFGILTILSIIGLEFEKHQWDTFRVCCRHRLSRVS